MKPLLATVLAVATGCIGGFWSAAASAEPAPAPVGDGTTADVVYAVGGARPPGFPWADYTRRAGASYFPNTQREIVDYPAGALFSWVPDMFTPTPNPDKMTVGAAVDAATNKLDAVIRRGTAPAAAVGLSQGTMALDQEQIRLANDPTAPPPEMLQFTTIGSPMGRHAFGASFLSGLFPPGSYLPFADYTMPHPVESQYDANRIVAAYDGMADFPDRPDNLWSVANALFGAAIVHTPSAFTDPSDVPPQNIRSTVNSRGATETTYLIPTNSLPLTMPLRFAGVPADLVDQIDGFLQPQVDAGYSRNDNPLTKPISVDPVRGMDVERILEPEKNAAVDDTLDKIRGFFGPIF